MNESTCRHCGRGIVRNFSEDWVVPLNPTEAVKKCSESPDGKHEPFPEREAAPASEAQAEIASMREKLERRDELLDQYAARQDELRKQLEGCAIVSRDYQAGVEYLKASGYGEQWKLVAICRQSLDACIAELDQLRARVAILDAQEVELPQVKADSSDHRAIQQELVFQLLDAKRAVQASYNKGWNDAIEAARLAYGAHYHKAHYENGVRTDACDVCGEDFRGPIHLRTGETVLNRIDVLAGKGK